MSKYVYNGKNKTMLQFIDISKSILYDMEKTQTQVLETVNACVSHEMRNPLNSIIARNTEKVEVYKELNNLVNEFFGSRKLSQRENNFI